jgi:hypothetical protein
MNRLNRITNVHECSSCESRKGMSGGQYNFNHVCCITNFMISLPTKKHRVSWLEFFEKNYGNDMALMIKKSVENNWVAKNR